MNITLKDTIAVNNAAGTPAEQDISSWTPEFIAYMLSYAHGVRMQRCTASVTTHEFLKTRQSMFDNMAAGEVPSGGGGGGPRQTPGEAGRIAYYNSKGGIKVKGQICTGKNLDWYDTKFTERSIWGELRQMQLELPDEAARRKFLTEEVPQLVEDNVENVLEIAMKDTRPGLMGDFIESERRKRNPVAETFKVKMVIKPKT